MSITVKRVLGAAVLAATASVSLGTLAAPAALAGPGGCESGQFCAWTKPNFTGTVNRSDIACTNWGNQIVYPCNKWGPQEDDDSTWASMFTTLQRVCVYDKADYKVNTVWITYNKWQTKGPGEDRGNSHRGRNGGC
ncbi:peptidase inhibitor family I36 protein [Actinomadura flavalba]|uniref:peptidase inhibitor family I36 protein n=1 Tax=Actinomadura flavalba TaxID=1120938 RepID=UPI0003730C01|nr:peptidase inhibitor family I36 protein [Actinomadura flavalba]